MNMRCIYIGTKQTCRTTNGCGVESNKHENPEGIIN